jgi:Na+/H+-dicarboxylate symporter
MLINFVFAYLFIRFVIPMGASVNMDGGAIRIICNTVWLAYQNGHVPTVGDYIILVLCATLGSMGAAPVPVSRSKY